jgi:hypothetical protein
MGRVAELSKLPPEDYLAWERQQVAKHEYFDGEVFAMAGGSPRHNRLIMTVGVALDARLQFGHVASRWIYTSANAGERVSLTNGIELDVDTIFAGVLDLPGD